MKTRRIELGDRSYDIEIGQGLLSGIGERVRDLLAPSRAVILADENVASFYAETVAASFDRAGLHHDRIVFPAGESSKSLERLQTIYDELFDLGLDRKGCIIALGGGVTGDLAGFAAATFMRGVRFVQVPTSLLAQVDSSSGGKTGVNHPAGKNMIGAFHQPSLVVIDTDTLATLPVEELRSGLAEVIKHGAIRDSFYFDLVESQADAILKLDPETMAQVIYGSCRIKGEVVAEDERETGVRALLNFGHTFGHAYEALSDFRMRHGEAVAAGMIAASHLSELMFRTDLRVRARLVDVFDRLGLPIAAPDYDPAEVLRLMYGDKKTEGARLRLVLLKKLGKAEIVTDVEDEIVLRAIDRARQA